MVHGRNGLTHANGRWYVKMELMGVRRFAPELSGVNFGE